MVYLSSLIASLYLQITPQKCSQKPGRRPSSPVASPSALLPSSRLRHPPANSRHPQAPAPCSNARVEALHPQAFSVLLPKILPTQGRPQACSNRRWNRLIQQMTTVPFVLPWLARAIALGPRPCVQLLHPPQGLNPWTWNFLRKPLWALTICLSKSKLSCTKNSFKPQRKIWSNFPIKLLNFWLKGESPSLVFFVPKMNSHNVKSQKLSWNSGLKKTLNL